jgi:hypothetical protein
MLYFVRFQVLMAASMTMTAFWDIAICGLVEVGWCFRGVFCLHHQSELPQDCTAVYPRRLSSLCSILFWDFLHSLENSLSFSETSLQHLFIVHIGFFFVFIYFEIGIVLKINFNFSHFRCEKWWILMSELLIWTEWKSRLIQPRCGENFNPFFMLSLMISFKCIIYYFLDMHKIIYELSRNKKWNWYRLFSSTTILFFLNCSSYWVYWAYRQTINGTAPVQNWVELTQSLEGNKWWCGW